MLNLKILPLDCGDQSITYRIGEEVSRIFPNLSCGVEPESKDLLEGGFNLKRGQYNASVIVKKMSLQIESFSVDYLLGVTDVDLYVPDMNFVIGLTDICGRVGLISLNRLKTSVFDDAHGYSLYVDRAVKEAVHEIGHVFGIPHCRYPKCVMYSANHVYDTDRKRGEFCPSCKTYIDGALG